MPLLSSPNLSAPKFLFASSPPSCIYREPPFILFYDPLTYNTTIMLFSPLELIERLDIDL